MYQLPKIPEYIKVRMAEIGPVWGLNVSNNVQEMIELFSQVLAHSPRKNLESFHEIHYGSDTRNVLDIFKPSQALSSPVLVFVHGGAFVDGSKDRSQEIYANVLRCFNRYGYVGVNLEYRLAPDHKYPEATNDIASAMHWINQNIKNYGGDSKKIFLMECDHMCKAAGLPEMEHAEAGASFENTGPGEQAGMIKSNLQSIASKSQSLHDTIGDMDQLPEWVQEKIAVADEMIDTISDYLKYEYSKMRR